MYVESGNASIAFDVVGQPGAGHDVLLLHAGVTDRRSWAGTVARLSPPHRCIFYDQRGFGETIYTREDGFSPVADACAVIDAAEATRPVIVGNSNGGKLAIDFALAYPERVAGLVLISAGLRGAPDVPVDPESPEAEIVSAVTAAEQCCDIDEAVRLEARLWLDGPDAPTDRVGGEVRALFSDMEHRNALATDPGAEAELPTTWDRLSEIEVPTLVLTGRLDLTRFLVRGPLVAARIPGAKFTWLDNVAHLPALENDEPTLAAISDFVNSIPLPS